MKDVADDELRGIEWIVEFDVTNGNTSGTERLSACSSSEINVSPFIKSTPQTHSFASHMSSIPIDRVNQALMRAYDVGTLIVLIELGANPTVDDGMALKNAALMGRFGIVNTLLHYPPRAFDDPSMREAVKFALDVAQRSPGPHQADIIKTIEEHLATHHQDDLVAVS